MMSHFEPETEGITRERVILEEIQKNPDLHHNALIKKIVPEFMAKTTFEKIRDGLIEKNVISCSLRGNKKFYNITENYQKRSLLLIERITIANFHFLQHELKRLQDNYHHKDVNEKISKSIQFQNNILFALVCFFTARKSLLHNNKEFMEFPSWRSG